MNSQNVLFVSQDSIEWRTIPEGSTYSIPKFNHSPEFLRCPPAFTFSKRCVNWIKGESFSKWPKITEPQYEIATHEIDEFQLGNGERFRVCRIDVSKPDATKLIEDYFKL